MWPLATTRCGPRQLRMPHASIAAPVYERSRDQSVRSAYVTILLVVGKQTHAVCKPKALLTQEMRRRPKKYCSWEIIYYRVDSVCFLICYSS